MLLTAQFIASTFGDICSSTEQSDSASRMVSNVMALTLIRTVFYMPKIRQTSWKNVTRTMGRIFLRDEIISEPILQELAYRA